MGLGEAYVPRCLSSFCGRDDCVFENTKEKSGARGVAEYESHNDHSDFLGGDCRYRFVYSIMIPGQTV
jgi:hypothetical protein